MTPFIYQEVLDDFDAYLDQNFPETIYLHTMILSTYRHFDLDSLADQLIRQDYIYFQHLLNHEENDLLSARLRQDRVVRKFKKKSLESIHNCPARIEWHCNLNAMQIIGTNWKLRNSGFLTRICTECEDFSPTVQISIRNIDLLSSDDPYSKISNLMEIINSDRKIEEFYFSFYKFYYSDYRVILNRTIDSLKARDTKYIALFLPVIYVLAKNHRFPVGSKKLLDSLLSGLKFATRTMPSELFTKYSIMDTIFSVNTR